MPRRRGHRAVSPSQDAHDCAWSPTGAIQALLLPSTSSRETFCGWADGMFSWGPGVHFRIHLQLRHPEILNIRARLQTGQRALVTGLAQGWVGFWGLPKIQNVLSLCCKACSLLSLLCFADCSDPHWTSFLLTPAVSLAISLSLTSVFTRKIIEKKVTRQSGHHLTGSDCLQLSGQGQPHPGREQRWGAHADSIITTLNCPQRLQVARRSERKMSS